MLHLLAVVLAISRCYGLPDAWETTVAGFEHATIARHDTTTNIPPRNGNKNSEQYIGNCSLSQQPRWFLHHRDVCSTFDGSTSSALAAMCAGCTDNDRIARIAAPIALSLESEVEQIASVPVYASTSASSVTYSRLLSAADVSRMPTGDTADWHSRACDAIIAPADVSTHNESVELFTASAVSLTARARQHMVTHHHCVHNIVNSIFVNRTTELRATAGSGQRTSNAADATTWTTCKPPLVRASGAVFSSVSTPANIDVSNSGAGGLRKTLQDAVRLALQSLGGSAANNASSGGLGWGNAAAAALSASGADAYAIALGVELRAVAASISNAVLRQRALLHAQRSADGSNNTATVSCNGSEEFAPKLVAHHLGSGVVELEWNRSQPPPPSNNVALPTLGYLLMYRPTVLVSTTRLHSTVEWLSGYRQSLVLPVLACQAMESAAPHAACAPSSEASHAREETNDTSNSRTASPAPQDWGKRKGPRGLARDRLRFPALNRTASLAKQPTAQPRYCAWRLVGLHADTKYEFTIAIISAAGVSVSRGDVVDAIPSGSSNVDTKSKRRAAAADARGGQGPSATYRPPHLAVTGAGRFVPVGAAHIAPDGSAVGTGVRPLADRVVAGFDLLDAMLPHGGPLSRRRTQPGGSAARTLRRHLIPVGVRLGSNVNSTSTIAEVHAARGILPPLRVGPARSLRAHLHVYRTPVNSAEPVCSISNPVSACVNSVAHLRTDDATSIANAAAALVTFHAAVAIAHSHLVTAGCALHPFYNDSETSAGTARYSDGDAEALLERSGLGDGSRRLLRVLTSAEQSLRQCACNAAGPELLNSTQLSPVNSQACAFSLIRLWFGMPPLELGASSKYCAVAVALPRRHSWSTDSRAAAALSSANAPNESKSQLSTPQACADCAADLAYKLFSRTTDAATNLAYCPGIGGRVIYARWRDDLVRAALRHHQIFLNRTMNSTGKVTLVEEALQQKHELSNFWLPDEELARSTLVPPLKCRAAIAAATDAKVRANSIASTTSRSRNGDAAATTQLGMLGHNLLMACADETTV